MANLYENLPEFQSQARANEQKRRIAEAMMAQGMEQQQPYSSSGRYVVPMSWTQGLAKVAQAMLGAYGVRKAQEGDDSLAKTLSDKQKAAYEAYIRGVAAPKAETPSSLRPEGVALQQSQQPQVGTMEALTQQGQPPAQVAQASRPTEQDQAANDESSLANLERFIGDPYANPQQTQAALGIETLRGAREDRADARAVARDNAMLAAQTRLMDIEARLQDRQLSREQQAQLAREGFALRAQIAAAVAGNKAEPAPSYAEVIDPKNPARMLKIDGRLYKPGGSLGDPGVIGVSGKEPTAAAAESKRGTGKESVSSLVTLLKDYYTQLDNAGAMVNPENGAISNTTARLGASGVGQYVGGVVGTQNQSVRDKIVQMRPQLLNAIRQASGMSARAIDSNAELKLWLDAASDPTRSIQSNVDILNQIDQQYGLGGDKPAANATGSWSDL